MENLNELIAGIEAMDPETLGAAVIAAGGILIATLVCGLIRYLMFAIGYSKMYRKAGIAGWKAFIPVYHTYNNFKISWNTKFFFIYAALYIVTTVLGTTEQFLLSLIIAAAGIAMIVIGVKQEIKMAKCFGKGAGTGILLILFPGITSLVLGFGKAEYTPIAE